MGIIRAQVRIPASTTVPEDMVTNTWHLFSSDLGASNLGTITTALKNFYDGWASRRSPTAAWTSATVRFYDLEEPEPRVPLLENPLGLSATVGTATLPRETCLCLSYSADLVSGTNPARRRGRIFLGPLAQVGIGVDGRPTSAPLTEIRDAADAFLAVTTTAAWTWRVYSPTSGTSFLVTHGWVDNEYDTQRSRGMKRTTRYTFS